MNRNPFRVKYVTKQIFFDMIIYCCVIYFVIYIGEIMEKKKNLLPQAMTVILVVLMIFLSEVFHEKEFIFPEITALMIGAWLAPKQVWKTSKSKLVLLIGIYAVIGLVLVKYIPLPVYCKILIGFILCLLGLFFSRTTFAPLISATILPIIIHSESWIYPPFAVLMSILVVAGQSLLEKLGHRDVFIYEPVRASARETFLLNCKRLLTVAIVAAAALWSNLPFMIAPPLIVVLVEMSSDHPNLRRNAFRLGIVTFLCACCGAYIRMGLCEMAHLPLTVSACIIVILMLLILHRFQLYFPPAGALTILPLLIDTGKLAVYPFAVLAGFMIFVFAAFFITKSPLSDIDFHI